MEEFKSLLNGIIYILTKHSRRESLGVVCKTFLESQLSIINTDEYGLLKKQYGGVLNEQSLNKILNDINETIGRTLNHKNKVYIYNNSFIYFFVFFIYFYFHVEHQFFVCFYLPSFLLIRELQKIKTKNLKKHSLINFTKNSLCLYTK